MTTEHDSEELEAVWFVYIVRCRDDTLYTGITTDVERRLEEHRTSGPRGAKYLRGRQPFELVLRHTVASRGEAQRIELWIKRLSKAEKERVVAGDKPVGGTSSSG